MKVVIAPDSFKGSLRAADVALAIQTGVKRCLPQADTVLLPAADGGEGTLDSLTRFGGTKVPITVTGPLGEPVAAEFGIMRTGTEGVIELASASGLERLPSDGKDPLRATTYGTGELIRHALDAGCRKFIIAIGGSATNDGGAGLLQALGFRLLDQEGAEIGPGGGELHRIAAIDDRQADSRLKEAVFTIAADVQNPLLGISGATAVYGPQKGVTPEMAEALEAGMRNWADRIAEQTGIRVHDLPGAGAAGGVGGALFAFFRAEMKRGIDIVIEQSGLLEHLADADVVITGEGRVDSQTASGKTALGIAQEAQKFGVPVLALAGSVGPGIDVLYAGGISSVHSIVNGPMTLAEAMSRTNELLEQAAERVMRTFVAGR